MRWLFSVIFWSFLALSCVVFFITATVIFLVTWPFDPKGRVLHLFSCFWAMSYFYVNPLWSVRYRGREKLPWRGPAVLVANHESMGDILVLFGLYRPFKWVSKQSMFNVPFLGWNMRLNRYVPLVRGDKDSIAVMMQRCEEWLDRGVPVLLFPEGSRAENGDFRPFKDGAFRLAMKKDCPLIPIVLSGTRDALPKHGIVLSQHADCNVHVLDPISPRTFNDDVAAFRDHVRALMLDERSRMMRQPEAPVPAIAAL